jgi:hypothetical protein
MSSAWTIGAQLSTTHSALGALSVEGMMAAVERAREIIDLEILIIGTRELPEIFRAFSSKERVANLYLMWFVLV